MGHGPDEAALGVHLRVAWRTLVLAEVPDDHILVALARLLEAESPRRHLRHRLRPHHRPRPLPDHPGRRPPAAAARPGGRRPATSTSPSGRRSGSATSSRCRTGRSPRTRLTPGSSLLLYTDGLLDAYRQVDEPDQRRARRAARDRDSARWPTGTRSTTCSRPSWRARRSGPSTTRRSWCSRWARRPRSLANVTGQGWSLRRRVNRAIVGVLRPPDGADRHRHLLHQRRQAHRRRARRPVGPGVHDQPEHR